jgi:hypothetical protein
MTPSNYHDQFQQIVRAQPTLMRILHQLAQLHSEAYIAAGVLPHVIWAHLHGWEYEMNHTEIDVIFYDENEQARTIEQQLADQLKDYFPEICWDVTNQAFVHEWYRTDQNESIEPLTSISHALSLWPETVTALALRLKDYELELIAPFGLADLFELKLRWNPNLVSYAVFEQRMLSKQFLQKWPKLSLIEQ